MNVLSSLNYSLTMSLIYKSTQWSHCFNLCVCVWYRWRPACRGSALISHGLSSATSDRTSIKSLCTTSRCSLQLVVSHGRMLPRPPWWPRRSSHSWMVSAQLYRCFRLIAVARYFTCYIRIPAFRCLCPSGPDLPTLLALLRDMMSKYLSNLNTAQRLEFAQFLTDVCVRQRALFQAVLTGAVEESVIQLHMEMQSPPIPCPLAEVTMPV